MVAPAPEAARGTPFGPRLHAVATYLKTFQALSYERLQAALSDLFGLTLSQGGLMNLLRRAQGCFRSGRDAAIATLRRAEVVACDETGVRIEGSNAYHWLFHSADAVVHTASPTRGAGVVRDMMDGHRPAVWISDRYTAQQGHADEHQTCRPATSPMSSRSVTIPYPGACSSGCRASSPWPSASPTWLPRRSRPSAGAWIGNSAPSWSRRAAVT
ncbi:hypothetical protein HNR00_004034 [Methylorubrum rhodinum]|uniref:Transposase IS66 central domain-containing protein n=1 Tax=Methylorubrum rhodinum TaxID=29428 RepID=A0A840ZMA9_9HYPH|nr:hypothetical protein [Methylorubrum rhodinum]